MLFARKQAVQSKDQQDIQMTLQLLHISEFRLFELAYKEWFGDYASESELELAYIPYLFSGSVPCWVRQFTRNIRHLSNEAGVIHQGSVHQVCRPKGEVLRNTNMDPSLVLTLLFFISIAII